MKPTQTGAVILYPAAGDSALSPRNSRSDCELRAQFSGFPDFRVFPTQPLVPPQISKLIHRDFPNLSTCYPQEIYAPVAFFVVPGDPLGEFVFTAKKRERQSGTRRPMGWKRKAKGHVPGAERERFERGCGIERGSCSSLKGNSFQGRSGL